MFLAAAPYFQTRFQSDPWILANSQSAILTTSTTVNLLAMLVLTNMQSSADYPFRIKTALLINAAVFGLLTLSTSTFLDASPRAYLAFLLATVALTSFAAGMMQNGAFSFAASFGRPEYTQAIMAGQGVAGILPPLTQIITFLAFTDPGDDTTTPPTPNEGATAAFIYFLTAVLISALTLLAFLPLLRRHNHRLHLQTTTTQTQPTRTHIPLPTLLTKLRPLALSISLCFIATMFFPVFTTKILSTHPPSDNNKLFLPGAFIPLAFFAWNLGDLLGRLSTLLPCLSLQHRPNLILLAAIARCFILPLYALCNLHGRGAVVGGDGFYLGVVQLGFGVTNGWVAANAMMAAGEWVGEGEREAAGGFMGLCLVGGLAVGSVLSFGVAGI